MRDPPANEKPNLINKKQEKCTQYRLKKRHYASCGSHKPQEIHIKQLKKEVHLNNLKRGPYLGLDQSTPVYIHSCDTVPNRK
jgi:hypothetical protein